MLERIANFLSSKAMTPINDLEEIETLTGADFFPVWDTSEGGTRKVTLNAVVALALQGLETSVPSWEYDSIYIAAVDNLNLYAFPDIQDNLFLYVSDIGGEASGDVTLRVTLPPNPINGQEIIVAYDYAGGDNLELGFTGGTLSGYDGTDTNNGYILTDEYVGSDFGTPSIHLKFNSRNQLWWKLGAFRQPL